jgi:hypothetical protein
MSWSTGAADSVPNIVARTYLEASPMPDSLRLTLFVLGVATLSSVIRSARARRTLTGQ